MSPKLSAWKLEWKGEPIDPDLSLLTRPGFIEGSMLSPAAAG